MPLNGSAATSIKNLEELFKLASELAPGGFETYTMPLRDQPSPSRIRPEGELEEGLKKWCFVHLHVYTYLDPNSNWMLKTGFFSKLKKILQEPRRTAPTPSLVSTYLTY